MHRILAIALCMLWSVAGLAEDAAMPAQSCASLGEATAGPEDNFRPPLEGEVIDKGRAYFHSAPRADCVTGVFVIPGDFVTVYKPSGEWLNVMYLARDGKETSGWLLEKRVRLRQAYGAPAAISGRTLAETVTAPVRAVATAVARCPCSALRGRGGGPQAQRRRLRPSRLAS